MKRALEPVFALVLLTAFLYAGFPADANAQNATLVKHPVQFCLTRSADNPAHIDATVRPAGCISGCATLERADVAISIDEEYCHIVVTAIYELGSNGSRVCPAVCNPIGGKSLSSPVEAADYALIVNNEYRGRAQLPHEGSSDYTCVTTSGRKNVKLPME
jgi:hypothetical protein